MTSKLIKDFELNIDVDKVDFDALVQVGAITDINQYWHNEGKLFGYSNLNITTGSDSNKSFISVFLQNIPLPIVQNMIDNYDDLYHQDFTFEKQKTSTYVEIDGKLTDVKCFEFKASLFDKKIVFYSEKFYQDGSLVK